MGRYTKIQEPERQAFIHKGNDCWECKDYKTLYMTIRPSNMETDRKKGRDPNHYILAISSGEQIDGLSGLPTAFAKGYSYADNLYRSRYSL
tara:strand:- start:714 stop:986 length:273 start_codon:yes stop_codon:yes gene_type:complete